MKISIAQQIEEVERELSFRRGVYPGLVIKGSLRQSVADYHMDRMRAALETLKWVRDNADTIKSVHLAQRRAEATTTDERTTNE